MMRVCQLLVTCAVAMASVALARQDAPDVPYRAGPLDAITDVPGVSVGHYTHQAPDVWRGTTVLFPGPLGGTCAADVRGSNPVTMTDSTFRPTNIGEECDAIVLTGGSAFGLATVAGVVDFLFERGRGVETRAGRIPIVPAAVIFDLPVGNGRVHPKYDWGYKAAEAARGGPVPQGNVGAGAGGTVGKAPGGVRMKGGLGTASVILPGGAVVGAMVVLNALGDIVNPATGEVYATSGGFDKVPIRNHFQMPHAKPASPIEHTTLVIIATNAKLTKTQLTKVAELAHHGLARAIRPVHTMLDGDTVFAVSVGWDDRIALDVSYPGEEVDRVGTAAGDVTVRAILKGMEAAESIPGWPSFTEWKQRRRGGQR